MKAQIEVPEGSAITNLTVPSGTVFPSNANDGELFFLTSGEANLYVYRTDSWVGLIRDDMVIEFIDATSNVNYLLPNATLFTDKAYRLKRIDNSTFNVTISGSSGQAVDGDSSISLYPFEALTLIGYNGQWYVI